MARTKKQVQNSNFILTRDNYYSREADLIYMSCSQYQGWLECEAAMAAKLQGRFTSEPSEAFLVGNYVHSYLESKEAHNEFLQENFDSIFKTKTDKKTGETAVTGKYAPFEKADNMLSAFYRSPIIKRYIDADGENEKIMHGEIFGIPWRIRIDKYIPSQNTIIDYKTCADLNKVEYNHLTGQKESFIETYGYVMRAAVYTEIYKQFENKDIDPYFLLLCVTKQDVPDIDIFMLNHRERYDFELETLKTRLARIKRVKEGSVKPIRCGKCEYCRSTKVIKRIRPYWELTPGFEGEREEDEYFFGSLKA